MTKKTDPPKVPLAERLRKIRQRAKEADPAQVIEGLELPQPVKDLCLDALKQARKELDG